MSPGRWQPRCVVDETFLVESSKKYLSHSTCSRRKQPEVKQAVSVGVDHGIQPLSFVIEFNHGLINYNVIRARTVCGLQVGLPCPPMNGETVVLNVQHLKNKTMYENSKLTKWGSRMTGSGGRLSLQNSSLDTTAAAAEAVGVKRRPLSSVGGLVPYRDAASRRPTFAHRCRCVADGHVSGLCGPV
jgi:hypothetical protein